jgi:hypothetical protein
MKAALTAAWILTVAVLGYVAGPTSFVAWAVLATIGLAPPVVMMGLWSGPSPTTSEAIREVLR